jgi:Phosphotransferase enzyme family
MQRWDHGRLSEAQLARVASWLPAPSLVRDLSWNQIDTSVLQVRADERDFIVKAAGPGNHHIGREIAAHESYTGPLALRDAAAKLVAADRGANVALLTYLDGRLVEGTEAEHAADTYAQAGRLLRSFHAQETRTDDQYEARATAKALAWLERPHRVAPAIEQRVRAVLTAYVPRPVATAPSHGDWQPRNWLVHEGAIKVIDFGRFDFRPAANDLHRLAVQQWRGRPDLEAAFLGGYGGDPRDPARWPIDLLREAVGTAVWAYQVGDAPFEAQGHRMIDEALALVASARG